MSRRRFIEQTSAAFAALTPVGCAESASTPTSGTFGYGPLRSDPNGLLDLPEGFSYRVLSQLGELMDDGGKVPDKADGMGCFQGTNGELILVRNHELRPNDDDGAVIPKGFDTKDGRILPGGTTHIVLDGESMAVKRQFRSLGGTIRNCAGGITPWNSWLSCEEAPVNPGGRYGEGLGQAHGWVFEVPADASGLTNPSPLRALGRFNHEAACVDPKTGTVYLTEDRDDGVLYRFLPEQWGSLHRGGQLQAMAVEGVTDTRNWYTRSIRSGEALKVRWIDLDQVESPKDDLRYRAAAKGAAIIARGEGIHMGDGEIFVCSTSGGSEKCGQVFRLKPGLRGSADIVDLFFESRSHQLFNSGDNLTIAPNGHLIVCEDQYTAQVDNYLRGLTPQGVPYELARLRLQTELAGACFSPDGDVLFVNVFPPTRTLAVTGAWDRFVS
ncbi:MAG: DUF839 domain-containing protein [Proteobacteria bacterium]|nr:DUF839 domain-containing protein [Pseudomonadota bacterium]